MEDNDNFSSVMQCAYSLFDISIEDLLSEEIEKEDEVVFSFPHDKEKVIIPSDVTKIEDLYECSVYSTLKKVSLTRSIEVEKDNKNFSSYDGCLYNKDKTKLIYCPDCIEKIFIPASVTSFESGVFGCCSRTTCIDVDKENQKYCSYEGCLYNKDKTKLIYCPVCMENIVLPFSVEDVNTIAFGICNNLKSITVEDGNQIFSSYEGCLYNKDKTLLGLVPECVKELKLPSSLKSIRPSAFDFCTCLESIEISCDNETFAVIDNVLYSKNLDKIIKVPVCYKENLIISDKVMGFEERAFSYRKRQINEIQILIDKNNKYLVVSNGKLCKK